MNCDEFRRIAGADPGRLPADAEAHRSGCPACADYHRSLVAMDTTIRKALSVPVPAPAQPSRARPLRPDPPQLVAPRATGFERRRWVALAASIFAGVLVGSVLWVTGPRATLADEVVAHIVHEPLSLAPGVADAAEVERILRAAGVRLHADIGGVSYVRSCPFRGHEVPHLVLDTAQGPVTVLVLRYVPLKRPLELTEAGYRGDIVPAGPGSIAVIGSHSRAEVSELAGRVVAALEFIDPAAG